MAQEVGGKRFAVSLRGLQRRGVDFVTVRRFKVFRTPLHLNRTDPPNLEDAQMSLIKLHSLPEKEAAA